MKVLFVFCDMIRVENLKTLNSSVSNFTPFEEFLNKIKGNFFQNCYTPSPDTPRSLGCLYSGLYPIKNGCDSRIKWPNFYLKKEIPNLFSFLLENKFVINTMINKSRIETGILPRLNHHNLKNYENLSDILNERDTILKNKDSLTFIDFPDYHYSVDDFSAHPKSHNHGLNKVTESLKLFFSRFDVNDFDEIFIFSDHGCKFSNDSENIHYNISDKRSKILMFHHSKLDVTFNLNSKLCSIMDVFPTIHKLVNSDSKINFDGVDLYSNIENDLVIEDDTSFSPSINSINNLWAIRTKSFFVFFYRQKTTVNIIDSDFKIKISDVELTVLETNYFENLLLKLTHSYGIVKKNSEILVKYSQMKNEQNIYTNGSYRLNAPHRFYYNLLSKLSKILNRLILQTKKI